jgi:hypothetical protein
VITTEITMKSMRPVITEALECVLYRIAQGKKRAGLNRGARTSHTSAETLPHRLEGSEGT